MSIVIETTKNCKAVIRSRIRLCNISSLEFRNLPQTTLYLDCIWCCVYRVHDGQKLWQSQELSPFINGFIRCASKVFRNQNCHQSTAPANESGVIIRLCGRKDQIDYVLMQWNIEFAALYRLRSLKFQNFAENTLIFVDQNGQYYCNGESVDADLPKISFCSVSGGYKAPSIINRLQIQEIVRYRQAIKDIIQQSQKIQSSLNGSCTEINHDDGDTTNAQRLRLQNLSRLIEIQKASNQKLQDLLGNRMKILTQTQQRISVAKNQLSSNVTTLGRIRNETTKAQSLILSKFQQIDFYSAVFIHKLSNTFQFDALNQNILNLELCCDGSDGIDSKSSGNQSKKTQALYRSTANGYLCCLAVLIAKYLQIPLRFPLFMDVSQVKLFDFMQIVDAQSDESEAMSMLSKNLDQILESVHIRVMEELSSPARKLGILLEFLQNSRTQVIREA
ncbi:hypothetical protein MP228_000392 [Amoeboaphelidium protococcarum]|nr:hypothetical protein MP228_000392 [Amoeboaphelidium protococcarum]